MKPFNLKPCPRCGMKCPDRQVQDKETLKWVMECSNSQCTFKAVGQNHIEVIVKWSGGHYIPPITENT